MYYTSLLPDAITINTNSVSFLLGNLCKNPTLLGFAVFIMTVCFSFAGFNRTGKLSYVDYCNLAVNI